MTIFSLPKQLFSVFRKLSRRYTLIRMSGRRSRTRIERSLKRRFHGEGIGTTESRIAPGLLPLWAGSHWRRNRKRKEPSVPVWIKKRRRNYNLKLDGIGIARIRKFRFSSDSDSIACDQVRTGWSESQAEGLTNHIAHSQSLYARFRTENMAAFSHLKRKWGFRFCFSCIHSHLVRQMILLILNLIPIPSLVWTRPIRPVPKKFEFPVSDWLEISGVVSSSV